MKQFPKVISIMPADGWYAIYREEGEKPGTYPVKIVCVALYDDGDIRFMEADDDGTIDNLAGNCVGVKYEAPDGKR